MAAEQSKQCARSVGYLQNPDMRLPFKTASNAPRQLDHRTSPQNGGRHVPNFVHSGPSSGSHNPCIARRRTYEAPPHTTVLRHNDSLNSCCSWWHHACPARIDTPRTCSSSRKPAHPHEPSRVQYPKAMYSMPPHRGHAAVPHHEAAGGAGTDGLCAITSLP